jgi:hypothetical protein
MNVQVLLLHLATLHEEVIVDFISFRLTQWPD